MIYCLCHTKSSRIGISHIETFLYGGSHNGPIGYCEPQEEELFETDEVWPFQNCGMINEDIYIRSVAIPSIT